MIYQNVLKNLIHAINNKLLQIIQIPSMPSVFQKMLVDATMHGRRFRPLLLLIVNKGVGGKWYDSISLGCAIELLHKASLVHDDLIDRDTCRRGIPTFWTAYDEKNAIVLGDILISLAFKTINEWASITNNQYASKIISTMTSALFDTAIGEWLDIYFESLLSVDKSRVETMTLLKSGRLISASMQIGALAGDAQPEIVANLSTLGEHIGIAFQMINDLNNITGRDYASKGSYGHDLTQRKKTVVTLVLQHAGITDKHISGINEQNLMNALKPVYNEIDHRLLQASACVSRLPNGFMKKIFLHLIKEAQSDWFWVDVNK